MSQAQVLDPLDLESEHLSAIDEDEESSNSYGELKKNSLKFSNSSQCSDEINMNDDKKNFKNLYSELSFSFGKQTDEDDEWQRELRGQKVKMQPIKLREFNLIKSANK